MAIGKRALYMLAAAWAITQGIGAALAGGAAAPNVVSQCRDLAGVHAKGFPVRPVQPGAIEVCERAAKAAPANMGVPAYLARAYYAAKRGDDSFAVAQRSAQGGSAVGMAALGVTYEFGHGTKVDAARAREWYQRGAELGNAWAQCNYAALISREEGELPTQREESARWFLKSAQQGFAVAQARLGALYRRGQGVEKDPAEALRWLTRARAQGDALASHVLGYMHEKGEGVKKDEVRAVDLYLESTRRGREAAKDTLLLNLFLGNVPLAAVDRVLAYAKSKADGGDDKARLALGMVYLYGKVVPADDRAAARWFQTLVDAYDSGTVSIFTRVFPEFTSPLSDAKTALSWMYASGRGVPQDMAAAVRTLYGDAAVGASFFLTTADAIDFWFLLFFAALAAGFFCLFRHAWITRCRATGLPLFLPLRVAGRAQEGTVVIDGTTAKLTGVGAPAKYRVLVMTLILFGSAALFGVYLLWDTLPKFGAALTEAFAPVPALDLTKDWATNSDMYMAWVKSAPPLVDALIYLLRAVLMISTAFALPFMPRDVHWVPETGLSIGYWTRAPLHWAAWSDIAGWEMHKTGLLERWRVLDIRTRDGRTLSLNGKTYGERLLPLLEAVRARTGAGR